MTHDAATFKKTKIIATIGPASDQHIGELLAAGVNGIRLNFSHGSHASHLQQLLTARTEAKRLGRCVAIIQDLSGPKIRLDALPDSGVVIRRGDTICFAFGIEYDPNLAILPTQFDFSKEVKKGEHIFLRDGQVKLLITGVKAGIVSSKALNSGKVLSHQGINLPNTAFTTSVITQKDRTDITFALKNDVDYVALSFVQSAENIKELKRLLKPAPHPIKIIAKIETRAAINNLEEIITHSDAIMIARGDLGIEIGAENVPIVGRRIIEIARSLKKPVIMATQMLESMMTSTQPSRAEANDVSTAVLLGVDAVMLSGETAIGAYPIQTVQMMKKIILKTEDYSMNGIISLDNNIQLLQTKPPYSATGDQSHAQGSRFRNTPKTTPLNVSGQEGAQQSISFAAIALAEQLSAKLILAETLTGSTALSIASLRPSVPIIIASPNKHVCNQLAILWGGKPFLVAKQQLVSGPILETLKLRRHVKKGDWVVSAFGKRHSVAGGTDTIRLITVP